MASSAWPFLLAALSISALPLPAEAGRHGGGDNGGGGGGGRLGQVSGGLGRATGGGDASPSPSPSPSPGGSPPVIVRDHRADEGVYLPVPDGGPAILVEGDALPEGAAPPSPPRPISADLYVGAQKVYDSDGSLSAELAFNQGRFRFGGALSRYYERQVGADALTFTLGMLYIGCRVDDGGPTRAYLEVGAVGARTRNDPVMDASVAGVFGGVRVEHKIGRRAAIVGDAQAMMFEDDVRAGAVRAGLRVGHLQASVRYLDLNVGPALFGPEVGITF